MRTEPSALMVTPRSLNLAFTDLLHGHCRKNAMFRRLPSSLIGHNCRLGLSDGGGGFPLSASFMSLRNDGVVDHGER